VGWFKQIIRNVIHKNASAEETKAKALEALQRGALPSQVATQFVMEMSGKDPSFARSPSVMQIMQAKDNPEALSNAISNYGSAAPVQPAAPVEQPVQPEIPQPAPIEPVEPVKPPQPEVTEIPDPEVGEPEVEVVDQIPTDTIPIEGVPAEEEIESEEDKPIVPDEHGELQSFEDRLREDNEDLMEEEQATSIYQNPTILESFSVPAERVADIAKALSPINKRLRGMFHPEIKIEYEGDPFQKPVYYKDGPVDEDFVKVKISGKLPSPTDEIQVRIKEPMFYTKGKRAGQPVMEEDGITQKTKMVRRDPKGAKIFARINHHALSDEEVNYYLKTEKPDSKLRASIESAIADNRVPYYNTITPIGRRYKWDDKFYFSSAKNCFKCKARQARNQTFLAAVVPPEQLVERTYKGDDGQGNIVDLPLMITRDMNYGVGEADWQQVPAREIPEEIMSDKDNPPQQEQLGGKCAESYEEIKIIEQLEKKIDGWKKTSREIEENNAENVKEEKKPSEKSGPGGSRGAIPSERLFTVAIALLREEGIGSNVSGRLSSTVSNFLNYIYYQNKTNRTGSEERRLKRLREVLPKITLDDQKIATEAINWWRGRLGSLGTDEEDKNKINLSILPTIDLSKKRRSKNNPYGINPNIQRTMDMMNTYLTENNVELEPYPEEILPEIQPDVPEEKPGEAVLDQSVKDMETGNNFVSKFKHLKSQEYKWRGGVRHLFQDEYGKEYIIFDNYEKDLDTGAFIREPSMEFNPGEEYYIRGIKGKTGRYNTIIENPQIIDQNRLQEYGETPAPEAVPEVAPEAVPEAVPQETILDPVEPEIAPEAPVVPPVEPEVAPDEIGAPPVEKEEGLNLGDSLQDITRNSKNIITTGQDSAGNTVDLGTIMPAYLDSIKRLVPNFSDADRDVYLKNFRSMYRRGGVQAMAGYMDKVEKYLEPHVAGDPF
jgi:hypothetical protein